ncbi:MAG TPA: MFS transporter, partial [Ktedonobacterales bacterium]
MARVAENGPARSAAGRPTLARRIGAWGRETRRYPRNVWLLLLFTLGKGIQLSIGQVTLTLYLASIGFKSDFIGLLVGVPAIGALVAALPVGYLADRMPRKPLLLITGLLNPVSLALLGVLTNPTAMLAAAFANGVLSSAYWVTIIPMLTEAVPARQRVSVMSLNTFLLLGVGALGGLLGGAVPALVGALTGLPASSAEPLRWGVIAAAIAVFLPTAPLFWLKESQVVEPVESEPSPAADAALADVALTPAPALAAEAGPQPSARPIWLLFILLLVPDVLYTAGEGAVVALEPLFFHLRFNLSVPLIGAIVAGGGLLIGVTALLAPSIVRRHGKLRVITTAQLLSAPIALLIGYAPWAWLSGTAELGRNLLRGAFEPVYATFAMERVSARYRARLSGFYSVTWSVGFSLGAAASGWLQRNVNLSIGFLLGAVLL